MPIHETMPEGSAPGGMMAMHGKMQQLVTQAQGLAAGNEKLLMVLDELSGLLGGPGDAETPAERTGPEEMAYEGVSI